jgi:hypothetical protein
MNNTTKSFENVQICDDDEIYVDETTSNDEEIPFMELFESFKKLALSLWDFIKMLFKFLKVIGIKVVHGIAKLYNDIKNKKK